MDEETFAGLATEAERFATVGAEVSAFALGHHALFHESAEPLAREFRRYARRATRLRQAVTRPPAVAVFGASQAGKSYLVGRFAEAENGASPIDFEGTSVDYLSELNPPGGQEATGLVSRFTTRAVGTPAGFPVALKLLSQTDLIRILLNTYLKDFQPEQIVLPTKEKIDALFTSLASRTRTAETGGQSEEDVEELEEYCTRYFRQHSVVAALQDAAFWPRARELAAQMEAVDRASLFAPLWGDVGAFTALASRLSRALAGLDFAAEAFTTLDALTPRESGILTVRTLLAIDAEATETISVANAAGGRMNVGRPELAALVAELTLPIPRAFWPFLRNADLLDFPGARAREEIIDVERFVATPGKLGFAFLRGKVDYLFQRYNEEQDIAAMLLCVGPSNQEVQALPAMINGWVTQTLGDTPEARAKQRNSLFLVLTKFDLEFERKVGEKSDTSTRWDIRLQASLLDFFGKSYEWPTNWTPGRAFDNLFWLRSTGMAFDAVFDYVGTGPGRREDRIAARAADFVADRRADYLNSALVRRHFADPEAAWDAGLTPNDGGISRLAAALVQGCDPTVKGRQMAARIADLARAMGERLRPFWRSDDRDAERKRALADVDTIVRALRQTIRAQRFGPLLRAMQVRAADVRGIIWSAESDGGPRATSIGAAPVDDDFTRLLDAEFPTAAPVTSAAALDYFDTVAERAFAMWDDQLQTLAGDGERLASYRLTSEPTRLMAGVITVAARRLDRAAMLAETLRKDASFLSHAAARSDRMALVVEDDINGFVTWLGFGDRPAEQRHLANGQSVFASQPALRGLPPLGARPEPYDQTFELDWLRALRELAEDNALGERGADFDRAANDALGAFIRTIGAP